MGIYRSVLYRLMHRLHATGMVGECPRFGKPHKTTPREERLIAGCARRNRFNCYISSYSS